MIWDEDPFDPGQWHRLGVNVDHMLIGDSASDFDGVIPISRGQGNVWLAMVLKLAIVNKRKELIQSEEIRNDHFLLMQRRKRHRVYDLARRIKKGYRPKTPKVCEQCLKDYLANRTDQKYCGKKCREEFYRIKNGFVAKD